MDSSEEAPLTEAEEVKIAMRDIVGVVNKLALRVIVLEASVAEIISGMPPDQASAFAKKFKVRIEDMMQLHANRLMPLDDAEIALATRNVLRAVTPG
jgi:hypothetical protein